MTWFAKQHPKISQGPPPPSSATANQAESICCHTRTRRPKNPTWRPSRPKSKPNCRSSAWGRKSCRSSQCCETPANYAKAMDIFQSLSQCSNSISIRKSKFLSGYTPTLVRPSPYILSENRPIFSVSWLAFLNWKVSWSLWSRMWIWGMAKLSALSSLIWITLNRKSTWNRERTLPRRRICWRPIPPRKTGAINWKVGWRPVPKLSLLSVA